MQYALDKLTEADEVVTHPADALPVTLGSPIEKCNKPPGRQIDLPNERLRRERRARRCRCEDPDGVDDRVLLDVEPPDSVGGDMEIVAQASDSQLRRRGMSRRLGVSPLLRIARSDQETASEFRHLPNHLRRVGCSQRWQTACRGRWLRAVPHDEKVTSAGPRLSNSARERRTATAPSASESIVIECASAPAPTPGRRAAAVARPGHRLEMLERNDSVTEQATAVVADVDAVKRVLDLLDRLSCAVPREGSHRPVESRIAAHGRERGTGPREPGSEVFAFDCEE